MRLSCSTKWTCCALGAIVLGALTVPSFTVAQERAAGPPANPIVDKEHLRMLPEQANPNGNTMIYGRNTDQGFYVYRNHFGPHQTSKPHYHDKDRWVTVIKGTWYTGEGDVFQPDQMVAIKEGGFMFHPAGMHHYDGSCEDTGVIVQIMGTGPVKSIQSEVDAKGAPAFANPANTNRGTAPDTRGCKGPVGGGAAH
jgi:quercetin dioxygenase-like cupin family protein